MALSNVFFLSAPRPPVDPLELRPFALKDDCHEFQTKKRRKLEDNSLRCNQGSDIGDQVTRISDSFEVESKRKSPHFHIERGPGK